MGTWAWAEMGSKTAALRSAPRMLRRWGDALTWDLLWETLAAARSSWLGPDRCLERRLGRLRGTVHAARSRTLAPNPSRATREMTRSRFKTVLHDSQTSQRGRKYFAAGQKEAEEPPAVALLSYPSEASSRTTLMRSEPLSSFSRQG